ncbi:hypothetical protein ACFSAV_05975 [Pasteurella oralis]|uniref:Outer membrane lopoprotein PlpP n=1 Tax=Pasteurella oralis TaxID=1071947 RepID=A0ABW4NUE9_9PAST
MKQSLLKISLTVALCSLLIACGGGGGGNGSNSSNQAQPIQPAPNTVPESPKQNEQAGNPDSQPQNPPKIDVPKQSEQDQPKTTEWRGQCYSASFCTHMNEPSSAVTVYKLTLKPNATPNNSTQDRFESREEKISLIPGINGNSTTEYHFTLLGTANNEIGYYGYRHTIGNSPDKTQVEVLYAINSEFKSKDQKPATLKAYYKKDRGFIYSSIDSSNSNIKNYGDVNLVYYEGKLSGSIYRSYTDSVPNVNKDKIFDIKNAIITPTGDLQGTIRSDDKAVLDYEFANSQKGEENHQYLFGSAKGESWSGILFAEKQQEKPAAKPSNK